MAELVEATVLFVEATVLFVEATDLVTDVAKFGKSEDLPSISAIFFSLRQPWICFSL